MNPFADPAWSVHWRRRRLALRSRRRPRTLLLASGVTGLSLLASACGMAAASQAALGSTNLTKISTGDKYGAWLAYSGCMRSHGVRNFPDPKQVAGGGIQIPGSEGGMNPDSPLFVSAQQSCRHLLPGGGQPTRAGQQQLARMLHVAQCMRAHDVSRFPDPSLSPPSNRAGYSAIMSNDGVWLAIPSSVDVRSPAFEQAAAACNLS